MKYKANLYLFCIILAWLSVHTLIQAQSNGDIRLTDGDRGIFEVYYNGWGPVCDDGWTNLNANVSCRILGYRSALYTDDYYYDTDLNYKLVNVDCIGNETNILDCSHTLYEDYYFYCYSSEHVYIICNPGVCESIAPTAEENPNPLQYYNNQTLYYVCADKFSESNGQVVCRENVGTTFQNKSGLHLSALNQTLPIYPYQYQCTGYENSLCECNQTGSECNSTTIAHIQCQTPVNGTVRHNFYSGLLEAYFGNWGYICDDYFDYAAADTVCRQLGYRGASVHSTYLYHNNYNFEVDNIRCLGNQFSINNCDFERTHDCGSYEHLAVQCDSDGCEALLPNIDGTSQIAYYFNDGRWNYICGNTMTQEVADVICKENGNTTARAYRSVSLDFGPLMFPIYGSRFQCNGTELTLCDCESISQTCSSMQILEVQCDLPVNGEVRLSEGHQGVLDIYRNGWGFVCAFEWNQAASDIACQILGFRRAYSNYTNIYVSENLNPSLNGATCLGNETTLFECEVFKYHLYCPPYYHVRITCIADGCESFAPYADERAVAVEYYSGSEWYYICANNFTDAVADVICIENSFSSHHSYYNINRTDLPNIDAIYPYTFECNGDESTLCNCTIHDSNCTSDSVIAVRCQPPENGDVRLTGGDQGELQLYQDGWNSVCDFHAFYIYFDHTEREFWAGPESNVACRTLGFRRTETFSSPYLYLSSTNSIYTDFRCFGNETSLSQCHNISDSYCYDGINLKCITDGCETFVPYADEYPVVAQFYNEHQWYTLSVDGFTQNVADMICRENNFALGALNFTSTTRSSDDYPIFPHIHQCSDLQSSLCECPFFDTPSGDQIVMIQCRSQVNPPMRLTDGSSGELLVYVDNQWGYVCYNNWDQISSDIACRQLGNLNATSYTTYTSNFDLTYPAMLYFHTCSPSNFDSLFDCGYTNNSDYYTCGDSYISLVCQTEGCDTHLYNTSDSYQEVRYFSNGQWYYLCFDHFTESDGDLICPQYGRLRSIKTLTLDEAATDLPIYPYAHNCDGNQISLCGCNVSQQTCSSDNILAVECVIPEIGDLRLSNVSEGILEIFYYDRWSYVCDDSFGESDARVACRQLGFKSVASYSTGIDTDYPMEPGINYVGCSGSEQTLLDCDYSAASTSSCTSSEHVSLSCDTSECDTYPEIVSRTPTPIRVFRDMNWNYLCANGFTQANAQVVCRENAQSELISHFPTNITDQTYIYQIEGIQYNCIGNELSLCQCPQTPQTCEGEMIINIQCKLPEIGDLRLSNVSEGILEIFYYDRWSYVCDDSFGESDARVACRQLGFKSVASYSTGIDTDYPMEPGINYVGCSGSEQTLLDCDYSAASTSSCTSSEHVSLSCDTSECDTYPEIVSRTPTPIRVFRDMNWNYLCANGFTQENAQVVCRENAQADLISHFPTNITDQTYIYQIEGIQYNCIGNELSLCQCPQTPQTCEGEMIINIQCKLPENGALRLNHGHEGLLEFYYFGWGYVCDDYWDILDSNVACRRLGFKRASSFENYQVHPNTTVIFTLDDVHCIGNETSLLECSHDNSHNCGSYEHVYLTCEVDGCEAIALQSDDSSVVIQFYDGQNWNYLCSDDFTMNNAHAICHENFGTLAMSYEFIPVSNLTYGYPFYPYQHNCVGNEASLCYCPISTRNCTSNEAVAIRCQRPDYGTLRLSNVTGGYLEVYLGYDWGYVCFDSYYYYYYYYYRAYNEEHLADLACRQIGYLKATSFKTEYLASSTPVPSLNIGECSETETNVTMCDYSYLGDYCYFRFSLECQTEGCDVIHDDPQSLTQLAQTYTDKSWFYLCFDGFTYEEADVFCSETTTTSANNYTATNLESLAIQRPIYPYQYDCNGTEDSLCTCPIDMKVCSTNEVTNVTCKEPAFGSTRLSDGYFGEIEVYAGQWRVVCQSDFYYFYYYYDRFNQYNADVACRSAGFRAAISYTDFYDSYYTYPTYSYSRYITSVSCVGDESSLTDCYYYNTSYCYYKPTVVCDRSGCESFAGDADQREQVVQFFSDGAWRYICAQQFTTQTGNVICHENGFGDLLNYSVVSGNNLPNNTLIHSKIPNCTGEEDSLCDCPTITEQCNSNMVISLQCNPPVEGTTRVSNGTSGYLQVYQNGWRRVCGYYFNHVTADVACRSLGFRNALSVIYEYIDIDIYNDDSFITEIICKGTESNILDCEYSSDNNCYYENGVICEQGGCETYANDPLLLCPVNLYNDQWYTVCADGFGQQEADVVCRELDHGDVTQFTFVARNSTDYPISPQSYNCEGNESSLCACQSVQSTCPSGNIVHIQCQQPAFGHIRLINGSSGLLESYTNGWKRVCNYDYYWNQASSDLVCRYLGYRDALSYSEEYYDYSYSSSGFINNVVCVGNETNLINCQYDNTSYCYYHNIISCRTEGCQSYIFDGHTSSEPARLYKDEEWFYLCSTAINMNEANVICRENGFTNGAETISSTLRSQLDPIYEIYPYNIVCIGSESSLCDCIQTMSTCGSEVATIKCAPPDYGTLRYSDYFEDLIEIYANNTWNFVCRDSWDNTDSLVACKQLGYTSVIYYYSYALSHLNSIYPTGFTGVGCDGLEQNLAQCNHTIGSCSFTYSQYRKILLYCTRGDCEVHTPLTAGDYHLVEYFVDEKRYYICATGFTAENADVVCRETAHTSAVSYRNVSELDLQSFANIYPLRHNCYGNESSLCNCSVSEEVCTSGSVVEVLCGNPENGSIRISSVDSSLEVYTDAWKYVCSYTFNHNDATVACRQLGYVTYDYWYWIYHNDITEDEDYLIRDLECEGTEANLLDCLYTPTTSCRYTVVLFCESGSCESIIHNATYPTPIRLYDGHSNYYLCASGMTWETADVVCREGSYGSASNISNITLGSTGNNYAISSNTYSCIGNERSLCDCSYFTNHCEDEQIAVVQCEMPETGQLRFHARDVLQMYFYGIWRSICFARWDIYDSTVSCRQLGYRTSKEVDLYYYYFYDFTDYWIQNVVCFGNESKLSDCRFDLGHYCDYYNPVNLNCVSDGCESYAPDAVYFPQVARYYTGGWYYLCADNFTELNADVVCNENGGILTLISTGVGRENLTNYLPVLQRKFTCDGNEDSLCSCPSYESTCSSDSVVEIQCNPPENGNIRLSSINSGVLEIYIHEWGYVCDDYWDMNAAIVACRQLGLGAVLTSETGVIVNSRLYPYLIDDVRCTGDEQGILDCEYTTKHNCASNEHISLSCGPYEEIAHIISFSANETYTLTTFDSFAGKSFECTAEGIPQPDIYWTQNFIDRMENSLLEITSDDLPNSTNVFYCVAENSVGRDVLSVTYYVQIPPVITSPSTSYNNTLSTIIGVHILIVCKAEGIPTPNVYWTQNFIDRMENPLLEITSDDLPNSTNVFYCVAESSAGRDVLSVTYYVQIPPVITSPSTSYNNTLSTIIGVHILIVCKAEGIPTPNVYWTRDNITIESSSTLVVTGSILPHNNNTFQCVAANVYGTAVVSVTYLIETTTDEVVESLGEITQDLNNVDVISDENAGQTAAIVDNSVNLGISNPNNTVEQNDAILQSAATSVELIVNKTNGTFSNETTNSVTDLLSTVVGGSLNQTNETDPQTAANQGSVGSVSSALAIALRTLETFSGRLSEELLANPGSSSRIVVSQTITIIVEVIELSDSDLTLPVQSATQAEYSVSLSISLTVAKSLSTSDNRLAIATSFIKRPNKPIGESGFSQASDILTTSIAGKDGKINLAEEVSFGFEITSSPGYQSVCVYLEETSWVSTGLTLVSSTTSTAVCESFHLTSFAVFVTPYKPPGSNVERILLSVLSYLILGISFISLIVSLILFCIAGKTFFKVETNIIYFNYCISMLLAVGLFLFGVESGKFNEVICKIIAFALHYAWLAVFTWTLCIGILIMYKLVFGVMSNRKIYPYLIVFGWVFPLVIPLITIIITRDYYVDSSQHCFLAYEQGVIWAFIIPVLVIILINVVFLIIAISKIIHNKWGNDNSPHKDIIRDAMVTAMVLTPVLGIPWLILILNIAIQSTVLEYLFIILNGFIGLIFLLVVVIRNREVQAILKRRKGVEASGTGPSGTLSSSATASSTVASRFKKTGAEMNTLERVQEKEAEIEDAAKFNPSLDVKSDFETAENIYTEPMKTMEEGATPDVQPRPKKERKGLFGATKTLFGGLKQSKRRSDLELLEEVPPFYTESGELQVVSDVRQNPVYGISNIGFENPVYGISNIGFESSIDVMYSNANVEESLTNPVYGQVSEKIPEQHENEYEIN